MKITQIALLVVGLLTTSWSARVNLIFARSGDLELLSARHGMVIAIIGILAFPAAVSFLIAPFLVLSWLWALALLLCALLFFGQVVTRNNLGVFAVYQGVWDSISVVCAIGFWFIFFFVKA